LISGHTERIASLDAFRGFAIASMVLVNNPGDWSHLHAPLAHAKWNGWTFTDMVFPFFLFAAGMAMAVRKTGVRHHFSQSAAPAARNEKWCLTPVFRRAAVIFLVGLLLNLFPSFDFSTVRIPGVLQRIALCIVIAIPVAKASDRAVAIYAVALMAIYSILQQFGALEPGKDFGSAVDRAVFGNHLWSQSKTWDPEGLVSTLPAAASLLSGLLTARWLLKQPSTTQTSLRLLAAGVVALIAGWILDAAFMPINKNLWTPSFTVFMAGWSLVAFAFFHATMDVAAFGRRAFLPLTIYGMNALFIFAFSGFVARLLVMGDTKRALYAPIQALPVSPENASLLFAVGFNLAIFFVAWFMWKRKWFVRA